MTIFYHGIFTQSFTGNFMLTNGCQKSLKHKRNDHSSLRSQPNFTVKYRILPFVELSLSWFSGLRDLHTRPHPHGGLHVQCPLRRRNSEAQKDSDWLKATSSKYHSTTSPSQNSWLSGPYMGSLRKKLSMDFKNTCTRIGSFCSQELFKATLVCKHIVSSLATVKGACSQHNERQSIWCSACEHGACRLSGAPASGSGSMLHEGSGSMLYELPGHQCAVHGQHRGFQGRAGRV